jgi:hypothetical protein
VPLIGRKAADVRAKLLAPENGVAVVAGMAEIDRGGDLGDIPFDELPVAAKAVAGEDQGVAPDRLVGIAAPAPDPGDSSAGFRKQRRDDRIGENRNVGLFGRAAQLNRSIRRRCGWVAHASGTQNGRDS